MPRKLRIVSVTAGAAIFILLEVAALAMLGRSATMQDIWLNRASRRVGAALWGMGETARNHFMLDRQNDSLALENESLRAVIRQYRQDSVLRAEKAGMAFRNDERFSYTPATVVKMSRGTAHNYIIINKGSEDGIRPQSGIITPEGVVGIISAVGRSHAYGLTLMNPNVSVSTRVGREGVAAPMVWDGLHSDGAVVNDIPPHYDIAPGDTVRTSGFSSIFPAGLPVGVTGESRLVNGSSRQVEVRLFQDFRNVHYVTVVSNLGKDEIDALIQKAEPEG